MVERGLPKPETRVRFPSPAPTSDSLTKPKILTENRYSHYESENKSENKQINSKGDLTRSYLIAGGLPLASPAEIVGMNARPADGRLFRPSC